MAPHALLSRLRLAPLLHHHHLRRFLSAATLPPDESLPGASPPPSNSRLFVAGTTLTLLSCRPTGSFSHIPSSPPVIHSSHFTFFSRFLSSARRVVLVHGRALPQGRLLLLRHSHRRYETHLQFELSLVGMPSLFVIHNLSWPGYLGRWFEYRQCAP